MLQRLKLNVCIAILLLSGYEVKSQDSVRCGTWVSANIHYGFIVPVYSSAMNYLLKAHVPAMEFDYVKKPSDTYPWQQAFHGPEMGLAFFYAWLGNPTELGNMIGAYPFLNFHLLSNYKEALYIRVGFGLAYMPVIYKRVTNHYNDVIGSHLNAMINLRLTTHVYLSRKLRCEAGFGITHCSDGNYQAPNLGINLLTLNTGLSYCLQSHKYLPKQNKDTVGKKIENSFFLAGGLSEREPPGQPKFGAVTLNYSFYYLINSKNKIGGGIDVFYNNTNIARMADESIFLTSPIQNVQLGAEVCYAITVGKFALPVEAGFYLYTMYKGSELFNRFGLRYYANKHIILNLTILTHLASADYIEWGMGYRL